MKPAFTSAASSTGSLGAAEVTGAVGSAAVGAAGGAAALDSRSAIWMAPLRRRRSTSLEARLSAVDRLVTSLDLSSRQLSVSHQVPDTCAPALVSAAIERATSAASVPLVASTRTGTLVRWPPRSRSGSCADSASLRSLPFETWFRSWSFSLLVAFTWWPTFVSWLSRWSTVTRSRKVDPNVSPMPSARKTAVMLMMW